MLTLIKRHLNQLKKIDMKLHHHTSEPKNSRIMQKGHRSIKKLNTHQRLLKTTKQKKSKLSPSTTKLLLLKRALYYLKQLTNPKPKLIHINKLSKSTFLLLFIRKYTKRRIWTHNMKTLKPIIIYMKKSKEFLLKS